MSTGSLSNPTLIYIRNPPPTSEGRRTRISGDYTAGATNKQRANSAVAVWWEWNTGTVERAVTRADSTVAIHIQAMRQQELSR
jgi:hypothetical protein